MKITPYRTCELCAHFERARGGRDRCRRPGRYAATRPGNGCMRFQARDRELEGLIREIEARRMMPQWAAKE